MATERHLLVIYYNFPPVKVPGAVRIFNLCQVAQHHFSTVQALTTSNRRLFQQEESLRLSNIPVTEVPAWDLRRLSLLQASDNKPFISSVKKQSFLGRVLKKLIDSFPFNLMIGDGGLIYILRGYQVGKRLIKEGGVTHIFSTFRPYSDHAIAYLLKKRFPKLIWMADFRDLHLDEKHGHQLFFWSLQYRFNERILRKADLLTTVSAGLARKLSPFHSAIKLLRNGIPSANYPVVKIPSSYFSIVYTGRIYPEEQTALRLFKVLSKLIGQTNIDPNQLKLTYAGPTPELWQAWAIETQLEQQLDIRGVVSLDEARQLQKDSAINLLLAFSSPDQQGDLSSKIYEYLASGNPIVAIINGQKDEEFEAFFDQFDPGLLIYNRAEDQVKLENFILTRYKNWQRQILEQWPQNQEMVKQFTTEVLFNNFFKEVV